MRPGTRSESFAGPETSCGVKKGLYIPGARPGEELKVDPLVLSGLISGPSYVSLETALSTYGLIPERVEEITCIT